jgi:hypothetical protein
MDNKKEISIVELFMFSFSLISRLFNKNHLASLEMQGKLRMVNWGGSDSAPFQGTVLVPVFGPFWIE